MSTIAFSTFESQVRAEAFPELEATSLVASHQKLVIDALIELQQAVPCLQVNHIDYVPQAATYFNCGATVLDLPRGYLRGLATLTCDEPCRRVTYTPVTKERLDCLVDQAVECGAFDEPYEMYYTGSNYVDLPAIALLGFMYPGPESDKACRAQEGFYAIDRGQLWIYPHLNSDEVVELKWDGIKREYASADQIEDDREVRQAIVLYLLGMTALREDCNPTKARMFFNESLGDPGLFQLKRAQLIWQCYNERKLPPAPECNEEIQP